MIAEAVLLDALEAVHSGRLRVHEAYRTIRAAESDTDREGIAQVFHNVLLVGGGSVSRVLIDEAIDQVVAFVQPAPQTINRDALVETLVTTLHLSSMTQVADRVLALLRPVDGVTLTRAEARIVAAWYTGDSEWAGPKEQEALAQRLEAAS